MGLYRAFTDSNPYSPFFILNFYDMKISVFQNAKTPTPTGTLLFEQYLEDIKCGKWQDYVIEVRKVKQTCTHDQYQAAKAAIPAVTISGEFSYRSSANLVKHSGIIAIDFDAKDNQDGIPIDELAADVYTYAVHQSVGGDGYVVYVKIDPEKHLEAFLGLEEYYLGTYKLLLDQSCKDVGRLRYVSWDMDLTINEKAKVFKKYLPPKKIAPTAVYFCTNNDVELVIQQLQRQAIDITNDYAQWVKLAFAFQAEFGTAGLKYFQDVSSLSPKYDAAKCDKKYAQCRSQRTGIGYFFWLAAQYGVKKTRTDNSLYVESVAKNKRQKTGTKQALLAETVTELKTEGITGEWVEKLAEKVLNATDNDIQKSDVGVDAFSKAINFIKGLNLRFNEVTRCVEWNGIELKDMDINTIYINAKREIGKGCNKSDIESIINSDIPKPYHPFKLWFESNSSLSSTGIIQSVLDCFEFENNENQDYRLKMQEFILKWLTSVVAQMNGTYSILCLVLCGGQGISKTRFFRELLPKELKKYFAESTLDNGKDDEMLMARKIIVLDDEFSGKSKKETEKMKAVLSKEMFYLRRPYGRVYEDVPRYAVLCGTSNNEEILTDVANRRIIPCNLKSFNYAKFSGIDKSLLWMELHRLYLKVGDSWMLSKEDIEDLKRIAKTNEQASQEQEAFLAFFRQPNNGEFCEYLTNTQIKNHIEVNSRLKISATKLGIILKSLGFEKKPKKINSVTQLVYELVKIS
jgi:predicted P-loop ATPase